MILSIITINYNNKDGLIKTIPSVLSQNGIAQNEFEYIIIDGGSTDGSVDIIKKYAESNDFPIKISKWISEKDKGIYDAINKGIRLASGNIIGLVNSGDTVVDGAYENILSIHKEHPDSILYGAVNFYKNGVFERVHGYTSEKLPELMIAHPASFVPKNIYNQFGYYNDSYRSSGDWDLFLTFYQAGVSFYYLSKIIINFDIYGISNTNIKLVKSENQKLLNAHGIKTSKTKEMFWAVISFILPGFCCKLIHLFVKVIKKLLSSVK